MEESLSEFDLSDINRGISTIENSVANTLTNIRDQPDCIHLYHEIVKGEILEMIDWINALVQVYQPHLKKLKGSKIKEDTNDQ